LPSIDSLRSPSQSTKASRPNIFSSFAASEDYTTYTFSFRKGLKWSDGEPVTTEDVRFVFEDLYKDPDVQRGWATELFTQGSSDYGPCELTIADDFTFTFDLQQALRILSRPNSWMPRIGHVLSLRIT
jgi:peptide/nickel transport system substrate-binding protein